MVAEERETILTRTAADDEWMVYSSIGADITKLLKNPGFTLEHDKVHDGTRCIRGKLHLGGVTIRTKNAGTIKRVSSTTRKRGRPKAAECAFVKTDGNRCKSLAVKGTDRCYGHRDK